MRRASLGHAASDAIRALLNERGIALRTVARAVSARSGELEVADGGVLPAGAVTRRDAWLAGRS
jgi:hypothetical protein